MQSLLILPIPPPILGRGCPSVRLANCIWYTNGIIAEDTRWFWTPKLALIQASFPFPIWNKNPHYQTFRHCPAPLRILFSLFSEFNQFPQSNAFIFTKPENSYRTTGITAGVLRDWWFWQFAHCAPLTTKKFWTMKAEPRLHCMQISF